MGLFCARWIFVGAAESWEGVIQNKNNKPPDLLHSAGAELARDSDLKQSSNNRHEHRYSFQSGAFNPSINFHYWSRLRGWGLSSKSWNAIALAYCAASVQGLSISAAFRIDDTDTVLENLSQTLPVRVRYLTRYWASIEPV